MGNWRIILTEWVGQAWKELYTHNNKLIHQTFSNLGLYFVVNGSEDEKLSIRNLPKIVVGN